MAPSGVPIMKEEMEDLVEMEWKYDDWKLSLFQFQVSYEPPWKIYPWSTISDAVPVRGGAQRELMDGDGGS